MIKSYFATIVTCLLIISSSLVAQNKETLTNKSVVDLTKAGLSKDVIISQINSSDCKFDVTTNALISLKKDGVQDDVINAMITKTNGKPAPTLGSTTTDAKGNFPAVDLMNHVYYYNEGKQTAAPLEKAVAGMRSKPGMFSSAVVLQIDGDKSSVRLTEDQANSFVINTGAAASPEIVLYRVRPTKGKREATSMKASSFSGMKTGEDVISVDISKLKDGLYKVTPGKKLGKGEYFFTGKPAAGANSMDAYAFGVD